MYTLIINGYVDLAKKSIKNVEYQRFLLTNLIEAIIIRTFFF